MPSLPFLPECIRIRLVWSDTNGHFGSRIFVNGGALVYNQPDLVSMANAVSTAWGTNMKADVANSYSLTSVECLDLNGPTGALGLWQGSITGTAGLNELPSNCSVNIRALIPQHYRGGHPVLHHPPASATQVAGPRNWTGTFCNQVTTNWQAFINAIGAIHSGTVVAPVAVYPLHYEPGVAAGNVILAQANGYLVPTKFGTMRRRLSTES